MQLFTHIYQLKLIPPTGSFSILKSTYMKRNEEFESYRNPHEDERYDGYDNNETCNNKSRRGIWLLIIVVVGVMLIAVW